MKGLSAHNVQGLKRLIVTRRGRTHYVAGLPHFKRNFSRDSFIAGLLAEDLTLLKNQLEFSAIRQGTKRNPITGEEQGKIHHEYPGVFLRLGLSTEYNACDTTALFLIAHDAYRRHTRRDTLVRKQRDNIEHAVAYILSHIDNGFFLEDPAQAGARRFERRVTYWKDTYMPSRRGGEPVYPVTYTLAHVMNMQALRCAARILRRPALRTAAEGMRARLKDLYDPETKLFLIAQDAKGPVKGVSSDSLHTLFYLEPDDIPRSWATGFVRASRPLETPLGYRVLDSVFSVGGKKRRYHSATVWPFEQAVIHAGAVKFGLARPQQISKRIVRALAEVGSSPEIFVEGTSGIFTPGGCDPQLWTLAAQAYFSRSS